LVVCDELIDAHRHYEGNICSITIPQILASLGQPGFDFEDTMLATLDLHSHLQSEGGTEKRKPYQAARGGRARATKVKLLAQTGRAEVQIGVAGFLLKVVANRGEVRIIEAGLRDIARGFAQLGDRNSQGGLSIVQGILEIVAGLGKR
jgi:hypothetical protein